MSSSENTLSKIIDNYLEERFNRFLSLIPYDKDKCLEAWRESEAEISNLEKPVNLIKAKKPAKKATKKESDIDSDSEGEEKAKENPKEKGKSSKSSPGGTCIYILTKGDRKNQPCDKKVKEGSYCSAHKKHENSQPKTKTIPDTPKVGVRDSSSSTRSNKSTNSSKNNTRNLTKHKETDSLWHPQTGIAFSLNEKGVPVAVNKIVNDKIQELQKEDLDTILKWGFPIDEELKEALTNPENDSDSEEEEEEEKKPEKKKETKKGEKKAETKKESKKEEKREEKDESDIDSSDEETEEKPEVKKSEVKKPEVKKPQTKKPPAKKAEKEESEKEESEIDSDDD